jgi:hypothetical protein
MKKSPTRSKMCARTLPHPFKTDKAEEAGHERITEIETVTRRQGSEKRGETKKVGHDSGRLGGWERR